MQQRKAWFDHLQPQCWLNTYSVALTHPGFIKDWRFCCLWSAMHGYGWQRAPRFRCQVISLRWFKTARLIKRILYNSPNIAQIRVKKGKWSKKKKKLHFMKRKVPEAPSQLHPPNMYFGLLRCHLHFWRWEQITVSSYPFKDETGEAKQPSHRAETALECAV